MADLGIFTILLVLSAFFSSSETAFFSLSPAKVRMLKNKDQKIGKIIETLKGNPQRLLITILIGNNIVNLFTASYATVVAAKFFGSAALGIATGVTTLFILIFGEIIPKSFAYASNEKFAMLAAWPIHLLSVLFTPFIFILIKLNTSLSQWFGHNPDAREYVTEDEVRTMSRLGVESGRIDYREHEMIENIFKFDDTVVGQVMTPWYKVTSLSGNVPIEQIAHFVSHEQFSRYPVYDGRNEDNIVGYIHVKDVMKALNSDKRDQPLINFISPLTRVVETRSIERVFRAMVREKAHVFLVHGEEGKDEFVGLISLEDIIEEILGEIADETDLDET